MIQKYPKVGPGVYEQPADVIAPLKRYVDSDVPQRPAAFTQLRYVRIDVPRGDEQARDESEAL